MRYAQTRICVPVCVHHADELLAVARRAAEVADLLEIRFDCLEAAELPVALARVEELFGSISRPLLFTYRPSHQGGGAPSDVTARLKFWFSLRDALRRSGRFPAFLDIEADLLTSARGEELRRAFEPVNVICSHHDFAGTPKDLERIYEQMTQSGAHALKMAVSTTDATDCLPVFQLLERARHEGRKLIAVAMGPAGLVTRVLGPSRGAPFTYAALDETHATAPGQPTAAQMRELYRVHSVSESTLVMGLVGSPVAHSLSPPIHNAALQHLGLDAVYLPLEVSDAAAFVRRMVRPRTREFDWNLRGLSVTAPHKTEVARHLDRLGPEAAAIGAVNTVVVEGDELHGYNTDAAASVEPLKEVLELRGAQVAVLGAGGAARALLWALRENGAEATVFTRDPSRARTLAEDFGCRPATLESAALGDFELVVNATPLGTRGELEDESPATVESLRGARVVYDLVYNPAETRLLREARAAGCETLGGLAMLVSQAAAQFKLWTGREAPVGVMRAAAEEGLKGAQKAGRTEV